MEVAVVGNSEQFLLIDRFKSFYDKIRPLIKNINDIQMLGRYLKGAIKALTTSKMTAKDKVTSKKRRKSGGAEATAKEAIAFYARLPFVHKKRFRAKSKATTLTAEPVSARTVPAAQPNATVCQSTKAQMATAAPPSAAARPSAAVRSATAMSSDTTYAAQQRQPRKSQLLGARPQLHRGSVQQ